MAKRKKPNIENAPAIIGENLLKSIYEIIQDLPQVNGVSMADIANQREDYRGLSEEEKLDKISDGFGLIIATETPLSKKQKREILTRVAEKIIKFETRGIAKLS